MNSLVNFEAKASSSSLSCLTHFRRPFLSHVHGARRDVLASVWPWQHIKMTTNKTVARTTDRMAVAQICFNISFVECPSLDTSSNELTKSIKIDPASQVKAKNSLAKAIVGFAKLEERQWKMFEW